MQQQPQGLVQVSGVVQGSEAPSSYVPDNDPQQGKFFWVDVPGLVSLVLPPASQLFVSLFVKTFFGRTALI
jgi:cytochrome oxidase assembly protein ShyY1